VGAKRKIYLSSGSETDQKIDQGRNLMYDQKQIIKNLNAREASFVTGIDGGAGGLVFRGTHLRFQWSFGGGWDHVSISNDRRCPTWEEMCFSKDIFWPDTEACMQYHPAKQDYVNCHPFCLHIWRPQKLKFPKPPSVFVGPK
jgi:hypothetical protein